MALKRIELQVINILGTHDTYVGNCFSSSRVLSSGETFEDVVEEEVLSLIENGGFDGHIRDIEWIDDTTASIRFKNEYSVLFSLTTQDVSLNIDCDCDTPKPAPLHIINWYDV